MHESYKILLHPRIVFDYFTDTPERPVITGAVNVTTDSLILLWMEPHHNNAPVIGFRVIINSVFGLRRNTTDEEFLEVSGLESGVTYTFVVVAFNDIGDGVPSEGFNVTTLDTGETYKDCVCITCSVI